MRNASMVVALLLLAACGDAKKQFDVGFKSSFEKNFAESCTKGAMDGGAPAEARSRIEALCACAARKLTERHSITELASLGAGKNPQPVEAAVKECQQQR
ncbi:MAG TPA: hypothetical protein VF841_10300 [Anaeromyxobacter sp.]